MTAPVPRLKPSPIPTINPVPEYAASPDLRAIYARTKRGLNVPWMGVVTMAFAHYRAFYGTLWAGIATLVQSAEFIDACARLRAFAEERAAELKPSPLRQDVARLGFAEREMTDIDAVVETFSVGNMPYLLIATIARQLLEGQALGAGHAVTPARAPAPPIADRLVLMEKHHADPPTRALYDDIEATLGLPFVNTDYRALCRWPAYFAHVWPDLKRAVESAGYESNVSAVHQCAVDLVGGLPNPGQLDGPALRDAAERDATPEEVLDVVRLFQWLLPGLITNVAYLRAQMLSGE